MIATKLARPTRKQSRHANDAAETFVRDLIEDGSRQQLPDLFAAGPPGALYRVADRNGVSVVVARTGDLTDSQIVGLMRYRLAQYLSVGFIDSRMVYEARMEHEPIAHVGPHDVHVIAGSAATGQILCYATLRALSDAPPGASLRHHGHRSLLPVEKVHGWGIYNRLLLLPDLPLAKVRELGRFVKNQQIHQFDNLGMRGPIEVGVALYRTLIGALRIEVEALVGDLEEGVAKQNFDYFHIPMVVLHGVVPYEAEVSYLFPRYQYNTVYPFATLISDFSLEPIVRRLHAVERALELPGKQGTLALCALKRQVGTTRSSLEPPEGLAPLIDTAMPEQGGAMADRLCLLDRGRWIRAIGPFSGLSVAEATILGSFLRRVEVEPGTTIVRQGDVGDDLYLIEAGRAEVYVRDSVGRPASVAVLGSGEFFGEIALLTDGRRSADVVAQTQMTLWALSKEAYLRYLTHAPDTVQQIILTAVKRIRQTMGIMGDGER